MAQLPHTGGKRGIVPGFLDGWNYPQATGTAPFNVGDRGCHAPFSIVEETDLDTLAESSPRSFHDEGDTALWCGEIGIDVVGMLLYCATPQGASHTEPLSMVYGLDWTDGHG